MSSGFRSGALQRGILRPRFRHLCEHGRPTKSNHGPLCKARYDRKYCHWRIPGSQDARLKPTATKPSRAINPDRSSTSGRNSIRKPTPERRFSTFGYRNRAEGSIARAGRKRHHMSVKKMHLATSANQARTPVGTLAAQMGNLFSSANFQTIANRLHKKDIQNASFGI